MPGPNPQGEDPTQFNNEPDAGTQAVVNGIILEIVMNINWGDFLRHFGMQVGVAMATAGIAAVAGHDYSSLGMLAPMIQGVTALATTAWNTYEKTLKV
jgi:hypothetical protein